MKDTIQLINVLDHNIKSRQDETIFDPTILLLS